MANITFKKVDKSYDKKGFVVKNFDLEIKDKEFVVLVGPSGCGKSTVLRMIAGLEEVTSGEIFIGKKCVNNLEPKDRNIAMVFQNYALYPHMTVRKNMEFALKLRKISSDVIRKKIEEVAEILDIKELLNKKPKDLSNGQKQRVALGKAMVRDADIFLLDEPFSSLDANLRIKMRAEILRLHETLQKTFIYVTHDQTEAMTMGDRIVVMRNGYIQQIATAQELYDKPESVFIAGFIGMIQMNLFDAFILKKDDRLAIKIGEYVFFIPTSKIVLNDLKYYVNREVVVGLRCEDIHVDDVFLDLYKENLFSAKIDTIEFLGSEKILYFNFEGNRLVAKVLGVVDVKRGDELKFVFNLNRMHIFDKKTEKAICH